DQIYTLNTWPWNATPHLTAGVQYRYADNKLGESFLQDGIIYSIKYLF
ncbi:hypothetical protein ACK1W2_003681, partial [Salmonella enterica]